MKTFVEWYFPAGFGIAPGQTIGLASPKEVTSRDPQSLTFPYGAYACRFFDCEVGTFAGANVLGQPKDFSGLYFKEGTLKTTEDIRTLPDGETVYSRLQSLGAKCAIITPEGAVLAVGEDTVVLEQRLTH